jgi:hypothetical protein
MSEGTDEIDGSTPLSDEYEWGAERLSSIIEGWGGAAVVSDLSLLLSIRRHSRRWRLPMPRWGSVKIGHLELQTPSGLLSVRRKFGWLVRRGRDLLIWRCYDKPVMFDRLDDAKKIALLHANDGAEFVPWQTCWAQKKAA